MAAETITPVALRICEAATYIAVSERTLWTLIKDNRLQAVRFGKVTRILRSDLDNFIAGCRTGRTNL
jgi:excisionase family DNA binding protein